MKGKLIVDNFGPIEHAEVELADTLVFIGPQSSGKSTLAKLLAITIAEGAGILTGFMDLLKFYNIENYIRNNTNIKIVSSSNEENESLNELIIYGQPFDINHHYGSNAGARVPEKSMYIPSERSMLPTLNRSIMSLTIQRIPIPQSVLFFGGEFEKARTTEHNVSVFNVGYKYEDNVDILVLKDGTTIKLSEASSGFQSAIPMLMVLKEVGKQSNRFFVVEEPEQNLYPKSQKDMAYFLAENCTHNNNSLVVTTHSPYILTSINNCLLAHSVGQKKAEDASSIIPKAQWINPATFNAYYVGDGGVTQIFNEETELIDEDYLDSASDDIMNDFDNLLSLE